MRIDPKQWLEWRARLENLAHLTQQRPELAWLWDVRIQVLTYLCSRYGRQLSQAQRAAGVAAVSEEPPSPLMHAAGAAERLPSIRSSLALRSALIDLHRARRAARSDIAARRVMMPDGQ